MTTKNTYSSEKEIKEIWKLFRENERKMKESSDATDRKLREISEKAEKDWEKRKEEMRQLGECLQNTDQQLKAMFEKSDKRAKETDRQLRESAKRMEQNQKAIRKTNEKWGDFMEAITTAGLVIALNNFGIKVKRTMTNYVMEYNNTVKEFDIIATNGKEIVVVEVKTSLRTKHVKEFLKTMKDFKHYFPAYQYHTVYGAMAYLKEIHAKDLAEKSGLLILTPKGNTVEVKNSPGFQPKVF